MKTSSTIIIALLCFLGLVAPRPCDAYKTYGYWLLDDLPVILHINPNLTGDNAGDAAAQIAAISAAAETWNTQGASLFSFVVGAPTAKVNAWGTISAVDECGFPDGCGCKDDIGAWTSPVIGLKKGISWKLKYVEPKWQSVVVNYKMVFCDNNFDFYGAGKDPDGISLQCTALHELGHVLSLVHENDIAGAIMNAEPLCEGAEAQLTLGGDDIAGIQSLYGTSDGDADGDGLSNGAEKKLGTNLFIADTDEDGLTDGAEINNPEFPSDPLKTDTDEDTLSDSKEVLEYQTDPKAPDSDGDLLSDSEEIALGTNPMKADTDEDGLIDGIEVLQFTSNPLDPDTDGDEIPDGAEAPQGLSPTLFDNPGPLAALQEAINVLIDDTEEILNLVLPPWVLKMLACTITMPAPAWCSQ